jgi:hypothetical protein
MYYICKVNFVRVLMNVLSTVLHKVNILMSISFFYSLNMAEITDLNAFVVFFYPNIRQEIFPTPSTGECMVAL